MINNDTIPQPGEVWAHEHHGPVVVRRRWNEKECVCDCVDTGRTALLHDCFLVARITVDADGAPLEAHTRDGRTVDLREGSTPAT